MRLHGRGEVIEPDDTRFRSLAARFPSFLGLRTIVRVSLRRISDSCGFAVPRFEFLRERETLEQSAARKGVKGLAKYRRKSNRASIDGLAGLASSASGEGGND